MKVLLAWREGKTAFKMIGADVPPVIDVVGPLAVFQTLRYGYNHIPLFFCFWIGMFVAA